MRSSVGHMPATRTRGVRDVAYRTLDEHIDDAPTIARAHDVMAEPPVARGAR